MTHGSAEENLRLNLIFLCSVTKKVYRLVLTRLKKRSNVFGLPATKGAESGLERPTTRPIHLERTRKIKLEGDCLSPFKRPGYIQYTSSNPDFQRVSLTRGQKAG
jgi:hypothetical protein